VLAQHRGQHGQGKAVGGDARNGGFGRVGRGGIIAGHEEVFESGLAQQRFVGRTGPAVGIGEILRVLAENFPEPLHALADVLPGEVLVPGQSRGMTPGMVGEGDQGRSPQRLDVGLTQGGPAAGIGHVGHGEEQGERQVAPDEDREGLHDRGPAVVDGDDHGALRQTLTGLQALGQLVQGDDLIAGVVEEIELGLEGVQIDGHARMDAEAVVDQDGGRPHLAQQHGTIDPHRRQHDGKRFYGAHETPHSVGVPRADRHPDTMSGRRLGRPVIAAA